jgi:hypothetical protein
VRGEVPFEIDPNSSLEVESQLMRDNDDVGVLMDMGVDGNLQDSRVTATILLIRVNCKYRQHSRL